MNARTGLTLLAFGFAAVVGSPLNAQDAAPPQVWRVHGFLSAAYTHNFDDPASETNTYRVFDFDADKASLDVAELVVQRDATAPGQFGFRADLEAGSSIPKVSASYGLFRNTRTGEAKNFDLQQAFVTWIAPVGSGLRLDAGKFVTPAGAEVIEGYDGYNDHYSRSFLFGYAIPFTHTGIKATYAWNSVVSTTAMVVNGWDVARDNNDAKSVGLSVAVTPSPRVTTYVNYIGGAERADSDDDVRHLIDIVTQWKVDDRTTLMFNYDMAREENGAGSGEDASWNGLAGYVRYEVTPQFALAARAEVFNDDDGARTGVAQRLSELTLTPSFKLANHFVVRGDLRFDHSDEETFEDGDRQTTMAVNLLYSF